MFSPLFASTPVNAPSDGLAAVVTASAGFIAPTQWFCARLTLLVLGELFRLVITEDEMRRALGLFCLHRKKRRMVQILDHAYQEQPGLCWCPSLTVGRTESTCPPVTASKVRCSSSHHQSLAKRIRVRGWPGCLFPS